MIAPKILEWIDCTVTDNCEVYEYNNDIFLINGEFILKIYVHNETVNVYSKEIVNDWLINNINSKAVTEFINRGLLDIEYINWLTEERVVKMKQEREKDYLIYKQLKQKWNFE